MMKSNKLPRQMVLILSIFLLIANGTLGVLLTNQSKNYLQDQMRKRMLDISNSAAALIDGDILEKLQKEDVDTDLIRMRLEFCARFRNRLS
ncbi:MAG: hypothetical protein J5798_13870 [Spirochaetaceae bacterium]|nr:hypothetical protein [Spirochaetaceae bacterium]